MVYIIRAACSFGYDSRLHSIAAVSSIDIVIGVNSCTILRWLKQSTVVCELCVANVFDCRRGCRWTTRSIRPTLVYKVGLSGALLLNNQGDLMLR